MLLCLEQRWEALSSYQHTIGERMLNESPRQLSPDFCFLAPRMKTYLVQLDPEKEPYNPLRFLAGRPNTLSTYLASSIFSGLCVCAVMQPADTALTRMYNQPVRIDGESPGLFRPAL